MKIQINQTLHGYERGHQLLSSSIELSIEQDKILLYQSDLTGSSIDNGFSSYLTGYPIADSFTYAFAKTWYAEEMPRPGCVWTHTLLIRFSDLGKIPDLAALQTIFRRPERSDYSRYKDTIEFDVKELEDEINSQNEVSSPSLYKYVYENPDKSILVPAVSADYYERAIIEMWSSQWPRLRRNFLFCTGALSVKRLNKREFDIQVSPERNLISNFRSSENAIIAEDSGTAIPSWLVEYGKANKSNTREFLWLSGADIPGKRANFPTLIKIFLTLNKSQNFEEFGKQISTHFPNADQGANLKSRIFSGASFIANRFTEVDVIRFLLSQEDVAVDFSKLDLDNRFVALVERGRIDPNEALDLWVNNYPEKLTGHVWKYLNISGERLKTLFLEYPELVETVLLKRPEFSFERSLWKGDSYLQSIVLGVISHIFNFNSFSPILDAIIEQESTVLRRVIDMYGTVSLNYSLNVLNEHPDSKRGDREPYSSIMKSHPTEIISWMRDHLEKLKPPMAYFVFTNSSAKDMERLFDNIRDYIISYGIIKNTTALNTVYFSTIFLNIGLKNVHLNSDLLVAETFDDVYVGAENDRLKSNIWSLIKRQELEEDEEDFSVFELLFPILRQPKRKNQVESWDKCEILIRTFSTVCLQQNYPAKSFLSALRNRKSFTRVVSYLMSFKKGKRYLRWVNDDIYRRKLSVQKFQLDTIRSATSE